MNMIITEQNCNLNPRQTAKKANLRVCPIHPDLLNMFIMNHDNTKNDFLILRDQEKDYCSAMPFESER